MNHTPTPWKIAQQKGIVGYQKEGDRLIYSEQTKEHIAETFQYRNEENFDAETSVKNAEFIVTACNAHEDLLEIAKVGMARMTKAQREWAEVLLAKAGVKP